MFLRFGQKLQTKVFECSVRHKHGARIKKKSVSVDPGVNLRKQYVSDIDGKSDFDMSELDEEADFFNVGEAYVEHKREIRDWREKEKLLIVRRKYFKEKFPNFLTWSDKEQMRYLHRTDPEEWSIENLSEGFPALPGVVSKIVKSKWSKENENKIKNHDKAVEENWNLFKAGKLQLPPDLSEHLKKFTNRKLNFHSYKKTEVPKQNIQNTRNINEFSQIIASYEALKVAKQPKEDVKAVEKLCLSSSVQENSTEITQSKKTSRKHITFDELKSSLELELESECYSNNSELPIDKENQDNEGLHEVIDLKSTETNVVKYEKSTSGLKKMVKDYSHLQYPQHINIPKKYLKKGCTYKLNDCYYDERGVFLYRVPGMY